MKKINVLLVGGYWSTNIGNAFYNLGIQKLLMSLNLDVNLFLTSDMQKVFWNQYNSSDASSFNPCEYFENMDYVIWSGPMMTAEYINNWKNLLERAQTAGAKVICLSVGGSQYTKEEVQKVRKCLQELRLYALFSRDHETYENYKDLFEFSYDGICCAFFIPEYFKFWKLDVEPYVVFNFEKFDEPTFVEAEQGFDFMGHIWNTKTELKENNKKRFSFRKYSDLAFENLNIIRTKNTCFQPKKGKYEGNNIYLSDVPTDYLNIYANAEAVFSDRVHTCVGVLL